MYDKPDMCKRILYNMPCCC